MTKVQRWVCESCGGVWFPDMPTITGKCPACSGKGGVKTCEQNEAGVVTAPVKK